MAPRKKSADGSVTIDLDKPAAPEPPIESTDYGKPAASPTSAQTAELPAPAPMPVELSQENDLASQLKQLKAREQTARDRAAQSEAARIAEAQRAQAYLQQQQRQIEQTQFDSVANAAQARQHEILVLKAQKADARMRGDTQTELEIDDKLMDAKVELKTLEDGKRDFERQFQQQAQQPQQQPVYQQPQPASNNIDTVLASYGNTLLDSEREWLRAHPSAVFDAHDGLQVRAAAEAAVKRNLVRGTPEYFRFVEDRVGFEPTESAYDEVDMTDEHSGRPLPAAPPSRAAPSLSSREAPSSRQVTLTTEEREMAKLSKISERDYAINKTKMQELKRRGYYQERG